MARVSACFALSFVAVCCAHAATVDSFVNYETPPVTPLDLSPSEALLAACNLPDGRVELFDVTSGVPVHLRSIPVGVDPVSLRFRTNDELWVVNQISDSISIVDVATGNVRATLQTDDAPADVEFGGEPQRAFVTSSEEDTLMVFDPSNLQVPPIRVPLDDDSPRSLDVSADGSEIYVSIFDSGHFTVLAGDIEDHDKLPYANDVVDNPAGPYGGANPHPFVMHNNNPFLPGTNSDEESTALFADAPRSSIILNKNSETGFGDGQRVDWTILVNEDLAAQSGRVQGWDRPEYGMAIVDANTLQVRYVIGLSWINMALSVNPVTGFIVTVGTRSHPYTRFESNSNATFVQANSFMVDPVLGVALDTPTFMNPHISRTINPDSGIVERTVPQSERDKSISNPRGVAWREDGEVWYSTGMGSNNIVVFDQNLDRAGINESSTIEVGEGPTGIVTDAQRDRLYVLNRFEGSISVVSTIQEREVARVPFFDPTPDAVKDGRPFLYDAHLTSGTGQVSCASCHVDAKTDKISWNLGNPNGPIQPLPVVHNPGGGLPGLADELDDFHPVKGDMMTQTLQDIIGKEPLHWRGDRAGIEDFNNAFVTLLADDEVLSNAEMAQFKAFLATIVFPPNPFRNHDNSLPLDLPLPAELKTSGVFGPKGQPMPNGNAVNGLNLFRNRLPREGQQVTCVTCHTLPTGAGTNSIFNPETLQWEEIPLDARGNNHLMLVSNVGFAQKTFKVPQLRSVKDKLGFDRSVQLSRQGFGFFHNGTADSLTHLLSEGHFAGTQNDQEVADLAAFLLAFSGSDFPADPDDPPGPPSNDSHAAVGQQVTIGEDPPAAAMDRLDEFFAVAGSGAVQLMVKRVGADNVVRGALFTGGDAFQSDQANEMLTRAEFTALIQDGKEQTFTILENGTGRRVAVDRDEDNLFDYDEVRDLSPGKGPANNPFDPANPDTTGDNGSVEPDGIPDGDNDFDGDGLTNQQEFAGRSNPLLVDTDNDGATDSEEASAGTDPSDPQDVPGAVEGQGEGGGEGAGEGDGEGAGEGAAEGVGEGAAEGVGEGAGETIGCYAPKTGRGPAAITPVEALLVLASGLLLRRSRKKA